MGGHSTTQKIQKIQNRKVRLSTNRVFGCLGTVLTVIIIFHLVSIITMRYTGLQGTAMAIINNEDIDSLIPPKSSSGKLRYQDKAPFAVAHDRIPHRIIIVDGENSINEIESPRRENTINTIAQYLNAWNIIDNVNNNVNFINDIKAQNTQNDHVWFLNDIACLEIINTTEPELITHFQNEPQGKYRADICRVVALYQKGGYYFDTDMQVVTPITIPPHITFTSPFEANDGATGKVVAYKGIFNSFMASAPNHPILRKTMDSMIGYYNHKVSFRGWMGPGSLFAGYEQFVTETTTTSSISPLSSSQLEQKNKWPIEMSLAETLMTETNYPDFPRHVNGTGCCCDYVVHNFTARVIYFYSRILGAGDFCMPQPV